MKIKGERLGQEPVEEGKGREEYDPSTLRAHIKGSKRNPL
jgi:hypothetical protein